MVANFNDELIRFLEQQKGIEFDAEVGFGWYWYCVPQGETTDGLGFDTKHEAALGACKHLGYSRLVIKPFTGEIVFIGDAQSCKAQLAHHKHGTADIAHLDGHLASH